MAATGEEASLSDSVMGCMSDQTYFIKDHCKKSRTVDCEDKFLTLPEEDRFVFSAVIQ